MQYVLITMIWQLQCRCHATHQHPDVELTVHINTWKTFSKWVPNENCIKKMNSQLKVTLGEQSLKCG
jgi:hypothetical protein